MDSVLKKIQENYGLDSKHLLLLRAFQKKSLDAKTAAKETGIPLGRIYDYLNFLVANRLIERSSKKPFTYIVEDFNQNVLSFMKHRMDHLLSAQTEIMDLMQGPGIEHVEIITNSKQFTHYHVQMITESRYFRYISLHQSFPYVFYPLKLEKFMKLRRAVVESRPTITAFDSQMAFLVHQTYLDAFTKGKDMKVICERTAFDYHIDVIRRLGEPFFNEWKKGALEMLRKGNFQVFLTDEYIPQQIDFNDRRVSVNVRHLGVTHGIIMLSKEVTAFYEKVFNQSCQRAMDSLDIIDALEYRK